MNSYYEVIQPFRYYRRRGSSLSNTYIGSSQTYTSVYDAVNAKPGTKFYSLVGGLFVQEPDGNGYEAALRAPKHIFERDYGGYSVNRHFEGLEKTGHVRSVPAPSTKPDYVGWRTRSSTSLANLLPPVYEIEPSPEMSRFQIEMREVLDTIKELSGKDLVIRDHTENPTIKALAEFQNGTKALLEWAFIPDFFYVRSYTKEAPAELEAILGDNRWSREDLIEAVRSLNAPAIGPN